MSDWILKALLQYDVGGASAGAIVAVILANVVAVFLLRAISRNIFRGDLPYLLANSMGVSLKC